MSKRNRQVSEAVSSVLESTAPVETVVDVTDEAVTEGAPKSIRSLIRGMILGGKPTKEIAEAVKAAFPNSAAAAKSTKHIAWYRSRMKRDGELTVKAPETPAEPVAE